MQVVKIISYILILIGALNWVLVGFFNIDLVSLIFGDMTFWARAIYAIVGISAILYAITSYRDVFENN